MPVLSHWVPGREPPKCNLYVYWLRHSIYQEKYRLVSSSSLHRGHNGSLTIRIIVRCRLKMLCPVRRYTSILRSRRHCRKANCVSPGVTRVTNSSVCRQPSILDQYLVCSLRAHCRIMPRTAMVETIITQTVTFGTARRGLGELRPRPVPSLLYQM